MSASARDTCLVFLKVSLIFRNNTVYPVQVYHQGYFCL